MNKEILEAFKENYEQLKSLHEDIVKEIKKYASLEINELITNEKYMESKKAVDNLSTLLENIKFVYDFDDIQHSLKEYESVLSSLRSDDVNKLEEKAIKTTATINEKSYKTEEVSSSQVFYPNDNPDISKSKEGSFVNFLEEKFTAHQFETVNTSETNIELKKNNRHFYLTVDSPDYTKNDYFNILEKMNEKKNIGFICDSEEKLQKLKGISDEWVLNSPEYKTKCLTLNFTTHQRLDKETQKVFEVIKH